MRGGLDVTNDITTVFVKLMVMLKSLQICEAIAQVLQVCFGVSNYSRAATCIPL